MLNKLVLVTNMNFCQVDKLEFEQNKLRDQTNNQKQELEFQIKTKTEEIEMIKVFIVFKTMSSYC